MRFANHFLLFRDAAGTPIRRLNSFSWLSCRLSVNRIDRLRFGLPGNIPLLTSGGAGLTGYDSSTAYNASLAYNGLITAPVSTLLVEDGVQIEYWRRDPSVGLDWYRHFSGLYRGIHQERPAATRSEIWALGDRSLLARRIVAWPAGTANRSAFVSAKGETIMKTLVDYNLTSLATIANGRIEDGDDWPASLVTTETDLARGNTVDWNAARAVLLETLQKLALVGGGDFDLVKADLNTNPLSWDFRFYPGQLGADRSATLTFAVGRGNMTNPVYELNLEDEATVAIVGGEGQKADRDYLVRYGANYSADNHIEMFVSSTAETVAGRQAVGDKRLAERQARPSFGFGLKQTKKCVYRVNFNLGDLATAVNPFNGDDMVVKVNAVSIDLKPDGAQTITGEAATP